MLARVANAKEGDWTQPRRGHGPSERQAATDADLWHRQGLLLPPRQIVRPAGRWTSEKAKDR